jgi:predicted deacylase
MSNVARHWIASAACRFAGAGLAFICATGLTFAADSSIESAALEALPAPTPTAAPVELLGHTVRPGSTDLLYWTPEVSFDGNAIPRGVLVANGAHPGPTLCLTGVVHGDEHNGLEVVRRVIYGVDPAQLSGTVIGVPIVNLDGFRRGSRYLPDRRDLNRYFPGRPRGSAASRLAYSLFEKVVRHCTYLVDVHTGSFHRTNLPQLRGDLTNLDVVDFSRRFGATVILHNRGAIGTLRRAATDAGIPTITLETGEPLRIQEREVRQGVNAIETAMGGLAMYPSDQHWVAQAPVYFESRWVRVNAGGVLMSGVRLGDVVEEGARLGTVTDPVTNRTSEIVAPFPGRVLGMALNQVVLPGYAAFHIGIASTMEDAKAADALQPPIPMDKSGPLDDELSEAQPPSDSPDRELEMSE